MIKSIYIAGPMSGLPEDNYPAFFDAEVKLTKALDLDGKVEIINPAKNDPDDKSWHGYMAISRKQIQQVDVIVCLPGWELSKGATEEVSIALLSGKHVINFERLMKEREEVNECG